MSVLAERRFSFPCEKVLLWEGAVEKIAAGLESWLCCAGAESLLLGSPGGFGMPVAWEKKLLYLLLLIYYNYKEKVSQRKNLYSTKEI